MKFRKDFVTNSSSSSFVAVFGKAIDKDLAKKSATENDMEECLYTGADLLKEWDNLRYWNTCNGWCWADPFPGKNEIEEDGLYFIYSDCEDVSADEWGEIDEDEVDEHYDSVTDKVYKIEGFDFRVDSSSGRNG